MFLDAIRCEIIPIHIGNPNHRHFVRTTPTQNEENLRASGLIPITRSQAAKQSTLIPPTLIPPSTLSQEIKNEINQNFEYSKRIGVPAKRSTYMQNSRNLVDHSYPQANSNYYEHEKQRVFNQDEMANYPQANGYLQSGQYQAPSPVHQPPSNLGYIPSNANNYDYQRINQYDYGRTPNAPYDNVMHNHHYRNQAPYDQHQQQREHQDYQANNNDAGLDKELNDIGLDGSLYDMPFNQDLDNGGQLFNDAMNFDIPNFY